MKTPMNLKPWKWKLGAKIFGMLTIFFLVALAAVSMTLHMAWQLEGAAAAINDAGSERMRSYRIAYALAQAQPDAGPVRSEIGEFDRVLHGLQQGDPKRPLWVPQDPSIRASLQTVADAWESRIKPMALAMSADPTPRQLTSQQAVLGQEIDGFVALINQLVFKMEINYAHNTNVLRTLQVGLVGLAVIGTAILVGFFQALVIGPVRRLQTGMQRMAQGDFGVRLPVVGEDEFGDLALGFNHMADHLENLYGTLEERVETKTRSLAEKNRELGLLYETTACLNEPAAMDDLCREFQRRVKQAMGADAALVRLFAGGDDDLYLLVQEGLDDEFVREEAVLAAGECLCGNAARKLTPTVCNIAAAPAGMTRSQCARAGFVTTAAFPVSHNKRLLGQFNLFFKSPRTLGPQESQLLETLGQHLGLAVENLRLVMREREMAISEERNLLAQELHDSIAQGLAYINIQVQLLENALQRADIVAATEVARQIGAGVQESYDDVRELLVHFRTRVVPDDLAGTLRTVLQKFEGQTGIATTLQINGIGAPLSPDASVQVLHIVQESLSNIRKHARAHTVSICLEQGVPGVELTIRDDGVGFDPINDLAVNSDNHVGLKIMKERCQRIGGTLTIHSAPQHGTQVVLTLPGLHGAAA